MSEQRIDGKCSKCAAEFTKIVNADKSFREDSTRYVFSDSNHEYNKSGMVYDIFRCDKCTSVIDESWIEIQTKLSKLQDDRLKLVKQLTDNSISNSYEEVTGLKSSIDELDVEIETEIEESNKRKIV